MVNAQTLRQEHISQRIKALSAELGFSFCGISQARFLEEEAPRLESWLKQGFQGQMGWMNNHFDKRLDPRLLVDGARSVISFLCNYYPPEEQNEDCSFRISKYAYGQDYHRVIKDKLAELVARLQDEIGAFQGRAFVDSAPVLDKAWAKQAGLGWVGKHSNLLNRQMGSFFFIAELIVDLDLAYDSPTPDYCGTCTACIDACPTEAIVAPYVVDGSRCISYYTIELKEAIPTEAAGRMAGWAFGCDICQDVCPWNRFAKPHQEPRFAIKSEIRDWTDSDWLEISDEVFRKVFKDSPLARTKLSGLQRNLAFLQADPKGEKENPPAETTEGRNFEA